MALPFDREALKAQLAELMFSYPPDVAVVNMVQGRRNNYLRDAIDHAWREKVRTYMTIVPVQRHLVFEHAFIGYLWAVFWDTAYVLRWFCTCSCCEYVIS